MITIRPLDPSTPQVFERTMNLVCSRSRSPILIVESTVHHLGYASIRAGCMNQNQRSYTCPLPGGGGDASKNHMFYQHDNPTEVSMPGTHRRSFAFHRPIPRLKTETDDGALTPQLVGAGGVRSKV